MADSFDYIIVGAGSSGCVLANRLSENPKNSVCVLEAGPPDWNPFIHIPAGFMKTLVNPNVNWLFKSEPSWGTDGRVIDIPRGKTLGGSSSINGMVFNRGQNLDFDVWAQKGNKGWSYSDLLPYFKKYEKRLGEFDDVYRGTQGELPITDLEYRDPLCEAFIKSAIEQGIPLNKDYNGKLQEGVSYVQRTTRGRFRVSAAKAFLKPAKSRKNLQIITNAFVTKINFNNKTAIGVEYLIGGRGGKKINLIANKEIILSSGVIKSPHILHMSGIGPVEDLKKLGIDVIHDLKGVGMNLRDHFAPRLTARAKNVETVNEKSRGFKLLKEIGKYMIGKQSIVNLSPTLVYCFWHSNEEIRNHDLQMTFTPASYKEGVQSTLDTEPGFTVTAWQQRPESLGWIKSKTNDPFDAPLIQPNYLDAEEDKRVVVAGLKLSRRLMHSKALSHYFDYEVYPGIEKQSDEELLQVARERGTTTYHQMGTCRMGPKNDPTAVVDDNLKVYGLNNLRVIDASIMPTMLSANLHSGATLIGEKGSDLVLGKDPIDPIVLNY
ncbi:GMC family oxidoreductase N-terminal domain-containing protein [bacterium]|nr:GMC family oxidoreductase N-terminal domain-containing protein [bacterium]